MSERPYSDDTIFSDTMHGISHNQVYPDFFEDNGQTSLPHTSVGSRAVRAVIPPVFDWGPEQATIAREQELKTPDGLNFSA